MSARCTFCGSDLPDAPPGTSIACARCGNLTTTPAFAPAIDPLPNARVDGPKRGASPPPSIVLPSRAGGVDELIGGGITILGIGLVKFVVLGTLGLGLTCMLGMLGMVLR